MDFKFIGLINQGFRNEMVCFECVKTCNLKSYALKNNNFKEDRLFGSEIIMRGTKLYFSTNFAGVDNLGERTRVISLCEIDDKSIIHVDEERHPLWEKDNPEDSFYKI